jgi:protein-S-isoprenylcysteine O-methyltransferase Ste14
MLSLIWHVLYWTWVASEVLIAVVTRTKQSTGNVRDRGSMLFLWIVIFASLTACEWLRAIISPNMFGGAAWLKLAAVIVILIGLAIRWTAILTLGKSFSANVAIKDSQKIYKDGLYRYLRHPSYLGLWLVFLATGLHARNWISFALAIVPPTAVLLYRIQIEEAALRDAFGEEYVAYSRQTSRLFPGIY